MCEGVHEPTELFWRWFVSNFAEVLSHVLQFIKNLIDIYFQAILSTAAFDWATPFVLWSKSAMKFVYVISSI